MWLLHNASATPKQSKTKLFPEDKNKEIQTILVKATHVVAIVVAMVPILTHDFFFLLKLWMFLSLSWGGGIFDFTQINNR